MNMAKKWLAVNVDSKGIIINVTGPYYGEFSDKMLDKMISDAKRSKASVMQVTRVYKGDKFVGKAYYDLKKNELYPMKAPDRYGPGYY